MTATYSQGHCDVSERFAPQISDSLTLVHRSFVSPVVHQQVWRPHQFRMNPDAFDSTVRCFVPLHLVILPLLRILLITLIINGCWIILVTLMIILPLLMRRNKISDHERSRAPQIASCDLGVHQRSHQFQTIDIYQNPNSNLHDVFQEGAIVHLHQPQEGVGGSAGVQFFLRTRFFL